MAATSSFSIFGEWSGNVRSTPTPKDCLRTVKVSRNPEPWRLMQMPSKTWIRWRLPSITLKWTRSVSPALNCGRSVRMLRCSRLSMTLFIGEGGPKADAAWYQPSPPSSSLVRDANLLRRFGLAKRNPQGRPVGHEDLADDVLARHGTPHARVARLRPVVAHDEVAAHRDLERLLGPDVAAVVLDVGLVEPLAVDIDIGRPAAQPHLHALARQADDPLHERAAGAALLLRGRRGLEDDHVASLRIAEVVDEAV